MSNPIRPSVLAAEARAAQFLIPPHEAPEARAAALAEAYAQLLEASAKLFRADREDLAKRVQDIARDAEPRA